MSSPDVVDELLVCSECGVTVANLGRDDDNVPESLRSALRSRLLAEHRCVR